MRKRGGGDVRREKKKGKKKTNTTTHIPNQPTNQQTKKRNLKNAMLDNGIFVMHFCSEYR